MPRLNERPEKLFTSKALVPDWDPSGAVGYAVNSQPGDEDFLAVGTSLDQVGEVYPHLTIQRTNETAPGGTGYNFVTGDGGVGQDRDGQLLVTARAEERDGGYTGDSAQYDPVDATRLVEQLIAEVEDVALRNAAPQATPISPLGSYRGSAAEDDTDETPTVRIEQTLILYYYSRSS
jgi:hypothetical protein